MTLREWLKLRARLLGAGSEVTMTSSLLTNSDETDIYPLFGFLPDVVVRLFALTLAWSDETSKIGDEK